MGDPLSSLIGFCLFIAIGAAAVGGRGAAGKVLAAPFRFGGWVLRSILGAAGQGLRTVLATLWRGFVQLVADAHRYAYGRWPGATVLGYVILFSAAGLYIYLRR